MKAVRLYAPGDLRVEQVDVPTIGAGDVLIKVMAVGVCGSDIPRVLHFGAYRPQLTIGHEFSGVIVKVSEGVEGWQEGQRVVAAPLMPCYKCPWCLTGHYSLCEDYDYLGSRSDGAMAEFVRVPQANLLSLPDEVSFEAGAMADPAANAFHGIWKVDVAKGNTVAVFGAGPIGLFTIQIARNMGAGSVIAVDIKQEKLELAKIAGADYVINGLKADPRALIEEITKVGCDVVLDTSGSRVAQNQAVCVATKHGRVGFVGISHDQLVLSEEAVNSILRKELTIKGSWNSFSDPFPGDEWRQSIEGMKDGNLFNQAFISHRYLLDEAPAAYKKLGDRDFFFSKVMFLPQEV